MRHFSKPHLCAFLAFMWLAFVPVAAAQTTTPVSVTRLVVRQTSDKTELWNMNDDGSYTFIMELPWSRWPELTIDVVPSPDGQKIAYTTLHGETLPPLLIIIDVASLQTQAFAAPGIASLQWSPTGDALLLARPSIFMSQANTLDDGDTYVFDLNAQTFTLVAETNEVQTVWGAKWLPSGYDIIYSAYTRGSTDFDDLYRVDRDGLMRQQLTNLAVQSLQHIDFTQPRPRYFCHIRDFKWSAADARWYYVQSCAVAEDDVMVPSLFSVDMNGDNRFITDFYEQFPDRFDTDLTDGYGLIDFFPASDNVYMVLNSADNNLWIVSVHASGQAEILADIPSHDGRLAAISPSKTHVAVSANADTIYALNTVNGQLATLTLADSSHSLCRLQWLDDTTLLVDQVGYCDTANTGFIGVAQVFAWDTDTGKTTVITTPFQGGTSLIIPPYEGFKADN